MILSEIDKDRGKERARICKIEGITNIVLFTMFEYEIRTARKFWNLPRFRYQASDKF
jgi:hypothetical protein